MKRIDAKAAALVVALAMPAFGSAALAQQSTKPGQPPGAPALGIADPTTAQAGKSTTLGETSTAAGFAQAAAASGIFEVESGRLAMDKSNREPVRAFGSQMVQDHTKGNQQLMALARAHGIEPQPILTGQQQQMMTQLQGLSGNEFDRQFLADQVAAHQDAIRIYEQARTSTDPGMQPFREFAAQTIPMLQQHLQQAQALAGSGVPTAQQ